MGMLATVMNSLALQDAFRHIGVSSRVQSALTIEQVAEPYIRGKAIRHLEEGKVVILPPAPVIRSLPLIPQRALRGMEMNVDIVLKATKVDGVYTDDPKKTRCGALSKLTFDEAINKNLKVMDALRLPCVATRTCRSTCSVFSRQVV